MVRAFHLFCRAAEGVGPYETERKSGADTPEIGRIVPSGLRGRFVKRPYVGCGTGLLKKPARAGACAGSGTILQ